MEQKQNLPTSEETQEQKQTAEKKPGQENAAVPEPQTPPAPPAPQVDYRDKFVGSSRESQVLTGKLEEYEKRLGMAIKAEPPTESELKAKYPEWDDLTDFEKRQAIEILTLQKQVAKAIILAQQATSEAVSEKEFNEILRKKNPDGSLKYPGLRDREDDFRAYCEMPTHKGAPLETLAHAFLFEITDEQPIPPKKEPDAPKRPTVERTGGGQQPDNAGGGISDEEAETIRKNDPKRYEHLLKTGKLKKK